MKTKLLALFMLATCAQNIWAQITITNADLPSTGTLYIRDNGGNLGTIDLSVTGPNTTWDYSALTVGSTDTTVYSTVSSTPIAYQFYFNNIILYSTWKADLALETADMNLPAQSPITITEVINYYKKTSSGYYQVGFGANISGIPTSQRYDPRDRLLLLPCNYNDNNDADFEWLISVPGIGAYGQSKNRSNEVDGWGTLELPYATYNTLRVKSTISGIDTFYVDQFSFGFGIPSTQIEYNWYANGEGEPVLKVSAIDVAGNIQVTGANFKHTDPPIAALNSLVSEGRLSASPVPAKDMLQIAVNSAVSSAAVLEIYDLGGKLVHSQQMLLQKGMQREEINVAGLEAGYYTLCVTDALQKTNIKFIKD